MLKLIGTIAMAFLLYACAGGGFNLPPVTEGEGTDLPGKIVWRDLLTDTPEQTRRFYSELFGWEFSAVPGNANYEVISHQGRPIGGMVDQARLPTTEDVSQWVVVMAVADIDQAAASVSAAEGTVLTPPTSLGDRGSIAVVTDAQGALLSLLQTPTGEPQDSAATPPVGGFLWDELWTADTGAASRFYTALAPFEVEAVDLDEQGVDFDYQLLKTDNMPRAGIRPQPAPELDPVWVSYLRVADAAQLADILSRVEGLGGRVLVPATPRPSGGEVAIIAGPSGAGIALQTWSEDRGPVGAGGDS